MIGPCMGRGTLGTNSRGHAVKTMLAKRRRVVLANRMFQKKCAISLENNSRCENNRIQGIKAHLVADLAYV